MNLPRFSLIFRYHLTYTMAVALLLIGKASAGWHDTIPPGFPPSVPAAVGGDVDYTYQFEGYSYGVSNGADAVSGDVEALTTEYGTVGSTVVVNRGVAERKSHTENMCTSTPPVAYHCRQSVDSAGNFSPNADSGYCNYAGGGLYGDVKINCDTVPFLSCCPTVSVTNHGTGWWSIYTHPVSIPPCVYFQTSTVTCPPSETRAVFGWDAYYSLTVHVTNGFSGPSGSSIPSLPLSPTGGESSTINPSAAYLVALTGPVVSGTNLSFQVYAGPPTNTSYTVQESVDLVNWSTIWSGTNFPAGDVLSLTAPFTNNLEAFRATVGTNHSMNGLGFEKVPMVPGMNMIADQLVNSPDNSVGDIFSGVPDGTVVYKWDPSTNNYIISTFYAGEWYPADLGFGPGEGVLVDLAGTNSVTAIFTGDIPQGSWTINTRTNGTVISAIWPQSGSWTSSLGYAASNGDIIYRMATNGSGTYTTNTYSSGAWHSTAPVPRVGESFWYFPATNGGWTKTFSVW